MLIPFFLQILTQWKSLIYCTIARRNESEISSHSVVSNSLQPHGLESMGFSRLEYWTGLPSPSPGDPPNPGIEPRSPALPVDSLPTEPQGKPCRH